MPQDISENKKTTTESEIGSSGVGTSLQDSKGGDKVSSQELSKFVKETKALLQEVVSENARLKKELETTKTSHSDDALNKLAQSIIDLAGKPTVMGPTESDNLNRSKNFTRNNVDGTSLMEAQATLMLYKGEDKVPVAIAKSFADKFGPTLAVSVNGVRVSVPCDGKTYYINKTHAEAIRERIAKIDRLTSDTSMDMKEINA